MGRNRFPLSYNDVYYQKRGVTGNGSYEEVGNAGEDQGSV